MSARGLTTLLLVAAPVTLACAVGGRSLARADAAVAPPASAAAWTPATGTTPVARTREGRFPHARHAGLFPTCIGCHEGIVRAGAAPFPAPESCNGCHDGARLLRVEWSGPAPWPSNLRFSHPRHAGEVAADSQRTGGGTADPALQCRACHALPGDDRFLAVGRARPQSCLACHAHAAPAHLDARNDCATCHVPLARAAALPVERIARFPRPPSHDAPDFLRQHAPPDERAFASCAVCHARESCARCHADAASERRIGALPSDARVARLVAGLPGRWPVPASHERRDWAYDHGADARRATASCATCHAQPSCRTCHVGPGAARVIRRLPAPDAGASAGVRLERARAEAGPGDGLGLTAPGATPAAAASASGDGGPPGAPPRIHDGAAVAIEHYPPGAARTVRAQVADSAGARHFVRVHALGYARNHGTEASAQQLDCAGCHTQRYCADCHAGEGRRRFHAANFVQRHSAEAWGREQDCASCHNPEAFCRSCHVSTGLASRGGLNSAYHTRQPGWLLQHGQAARQGLESCTTCHAQRDCMQCHSRAGWNVSPHGRDFDARRMARRAPGTCTACHVGDPLAGRR